MLNYIYIIGIAQGLLLCFNFFQKSKTDKQYFWLGSLILSAVFLILGSWIENKSLQESFQIIYFFISGVILLIGPFLFLFVKSSVDKNQKEKKYLLFHFVPATLFYVILILMSIFSKEVFTINNKASKITDYFNALNLVLPVLKLVHLLLYSILSIQVIRASKEEENILLKWFVNGYLLLQIIVWLSLIFSFFFSNTIFTQYTDLFLGLVLAIAIYIFGYLSIKQSDILPRKMAIVIKKQYKASKLTATESQNYFKKTISIIEGEELFLNPDLNLKLLSNRLHISQHYLSQVINENSNYNFSGLINHYRIKKVKELFADNKYSKFTILAIAFEAGFNNKNSFNLSFKKETKTTPSAYRKALKNN